MHRPRVFPQLHTVTVPLLKIPAGTLPSIAQPGKTWLPVSPRLSFSLTDARLLPFNPAALIILREIGSDQLIIHSEPVHSFSDPHGKGTYYQH